jgi:hypothetical protein
MITKDGVEKAKRGTEIGERITAYLKSGDLTDRQGNRLGTYKITSTWHVGRHRDPIHQVCALVDGVTYTGRSQGEGYVFRGRRIKS